MTLTKEKRNSHKQRKLPNDKRPVKGSNGRFRRISTDAKNGIRFLYVGLIRYIVTGPLKMVSGIYQALYFTENQITRKKPERLGTLCVSSLGETLDGIFHQEG